MAEKDITEKLLEDYNDVFADIVNVLLFSGKNIVNENDLESGTVHSMYKADGKIHELERDVAKYWKQGKVRIALCGLENQTAIDPTMPMRILNYDGQSYRAELLKDKGKRDKFVPVITLVLYFGTNRWIKPKTLYECLELKDELKPFVNDYKINLFEIAFLSDETAKMFKSDFRFVVDYFIQIRKNGDYKPSQEAMSHVDEILKMMAVLTHDDRFLEVQQQSEGGVRTMCDVLERAEQKGIQEGKVNLLLDLVRDGQLSLQEAAKRAGLTEDEFTEKLSVVK